MVRRMLYILIMVLTVGSLYAQSPTQEINAIKQQTDKYLYAESTDATWDNALDNAKVMLEENVRLWAKSKGDADTESSVGHLMANRKEIKAMRGNLYRAFVYVSISEFANTEAEPNVPVVKELPSTKENSTSSEPVESKVQNEQKSEESVTMHIGGAVLQGAETKVEEGKPVHLSDYEKKIVGIVDANDIGPFIKKSQQDGYVTNYGKYSNIPSDGECYVFVYTRELKVAAHLKKTGSKYTNLINGKIDDITNYKGCGAYWFQIK